MARATKEGASGMKGGTQIIDIQGIGDLGSGDLGSGDLGIGDIGIGDLVF